MRDDDQQQQQWHSLCFHCKWKEDEKEDKKVVDNAKIAQQSENPLEENPFAMYSVVVFISNFASIFVSSFSFSFDDERIIPKIQIKNTAVGLISKRFALCWIYVTVCTWHHLIVTSEKCYKMEKRRKFSFDDMAK